jgi:ferric-dicitrate binding protein FerR (iron transport regulator)
MNNEDESTYTLLVGSEETGRSIMETVVYALLGLSAIASIWQFAQQPNPLPLDRVTASGQGRAAKAERLFFGHRLTMNERSFISSSSCH